MMKNTLFAAFLILAFGFPAAAQTNDWHDQTSVNPDVKAICRIWNDLFSALNTGDVEKAFSQYTKKSAIISIEGVLMLDMDALKRDMSNSLKTADPKPVFHFANLQIRLLSGDTALAVYDVSLEYKQVVVSRAKAFDLLRKTGGQWAIEFEQMTPVAPAAPGN